MHPRHKFYLSSGIFSLVLVLTLSFLIYNSNPSLTGMAVLSQSNSQISDNFSKQEAINAIAESRSIIDELKNMSLSTVYLEDSLLQAKNIFNILGYVEILNSKNSTKKQIADATAALSLTNWKQLSYSNIGIIANNIKDRRNQALLLLDQLSVENKKITQETSQQTKDILTRANIAFKEERYNDTSKLIDNFISAYEKEQEQKTTFSALKEGSKNFIQKNWLSILIFILILIIMYYFLEKKIKKKMLRNKIEKMKSEKLILIELIKKTQRERFETKTLSGIVYNIRLKKYQDRLREIEQDLPVMEKFLKKGK